MGRFPTGVAVAATPAPGGPHGVTINSLVSVSLDPLILLFCLKTTSRMARYLAIEGPFSINLLADHQEGVSRHFAGSPGDASITWHELDECPILADCTAGFVCRVVKLHTVGDHLIVYGEVTAMTGGERSSPPLLYYQGAYSQFRSSCAA